MTARPLKLRRLLAKAKREGWLSWVRSERDERAVLGGCVFDKLKARHVFNFFTQFLRLSKGQWAGKPFELQPWQMEDLLGPIFGWVREDGTRRFRRCWVEIPKKNGKSTLGAGIGLYLTFADSEPGAHVYSAATKKDQAYIVHDEAIKMVNASPMLLARSRIDKTTRVITCAATVSKYGVLSYDAGGTEGQDIHGLIADEVHAWRGRAFWDALRYAGIARRQPLVFGITTAGLNDDSTLGYQEHCYAESVLDGAITDDDLFVYIRAAKATDDYLDPKVHEKANPSYGITIKPEEMVKSAKLASQKKTELGPFLRYRLNLWREDAETFINMQKWDSCGGRADEALLSGRRCFGGLDLANKIDVVAWVLLFPPDDDDKLWRVVPRFWIPRDTAEKRESEQGVKYMTWAREGYITLTPGNSVDYDVVKTQIISDLTRFDVPEVGADPWNLEYIRQRVTDEIGGTEFIEVPQNHRNLSEPTKELEALILDEKLAHANNPVLRWMALSAKVAEDSNSNIKLTKKKSKGKIDGITAIVDALARAMLNREDDSTYVTDQMIIL